MSFSFTATSTDHSSESSRARTGVLSTAHGTVQTPAFMAVGTRASVTGLDPRDLIETGTQVVLGNTYHLLLRPGPELFERVGGIHKFMAWDGPVLTDSGGFQIFSMPGKRTIREHGARFRSYIDKRVHELTPELSVAMQESIGSDIMMVLDECVDSTSSEDDTRAAMERTHRWALRSLAARTRPDSALFAIVQGGVRPDLRRESAAFLTQHPFDGFAIGGLAVGETRAEREAMTRLVADLLPPDKPRYLMGVGTPPDLLEAISAGVDMFDCILPTNFASQGTAFTSTGRVKITRLEYRDADVPLDALCECSTCTTYTRSYLYHLFKCREPIAPRLFSIHNLFYYNALLASARAHIEQSTFSEWKHDILHAIDRHEHSSQRFSAGAGHI